MGNKFYELTEDQKKKLNEISARVSANNEGYRLAAQAFSEFQTQALIERDLFYKEICKIMLWDWTDIHKRGLAIKIEAGVARIIEVNTKKEEVKNV